MHKLRKRVGLKLSALILIGILISPIVVDAAQKPSSSSGTAEDKACANALYGGSSITKSSDGNNMYITIYAKEGTWDVSYYLGDEDYDYTDVVTESGLKNSSKKTSFTYKGGASVVQTIPKTSEAQKIFVFMSLREKEKGHGMNAGGGLLKVPYRSGETECKAGSFSVSDSGNIKITGSGAVATFTIPAKSSKSSRNSTSNKQCQAMINGTYYADGRASTYNLVGSDLASYNEKMKQVFPYCYGNYDASFDVTNATIKSVRQKSLKAYKTYLEFKSAKSDNSLFDAASQEIASENYIKIDLNGKKATIEDTLKCNKSATDDTTEKYYTTKVEENNSVCKVTCQEQFQVTYGPPVATKAGLCFQYKVTVKSKVTCKVEQKADINWPTAPETCDYVPICSNNDSETQAGPNEEFDSCVNSCDGGKYTQSCINKCYDKVYKNTKSSTTKKTSTKSLSDTKVVQLAKSTKDPFYQDNKCSTNSKILANLDYCSEFFYKTKQEYPMGYYTKHSGSPSWIDYDWVYCKNQNYGSGNNCKITDDDGNSISYTVDASDNSTGVEDIVESLKRSSPYYLRTKAETKKLIRALTLDSANGYNGRGGIKKYNIDNNGIKRQHSTTYQCNETCGYVVNTSSASCKNSSKEIQAYYEEQLETIEASLSKCTAKATCDEKTATFYIDVINNKTTDDETHKEKWEATNKSSETESEVNNKGSGDYEMFIPLDSDKETIEPINGINGKCYARNNPLYWQHYKTTITFPGTWIDLKTGERKYSEPSSDKKDSYKEKKNYFCVGFDSEDVNIAWWNWKINNDGDIDNITIDKDNNITAKVDDFGKYNWNLKINCFYGLYSGITPDCEDGECSSIDEDGKCKDSDNCTTIDNYKFRIVDQENMFPSGKTGFNWTSAATDETLKDSGSSYYVNPGEYAQTTQATANDAYSGTPDYEVYLTKENLKDLKSYATKNTYTNFGGTYPNKYIDKDGEGKTVSGFRAYEIDSQVTSMTSAFKRFTTIGVNNAGKTK